MTRVEVVRKDGHIVSLNVTGHSDFADEGEDIVCAALSSVIQTAVMGLLKVAGIDCKYVIYETEGGLELELPKLNNSDRHNADMILDTMLCGIADLYEGYSDFIELEVK